MNVEHIILTKRSQTQKQVAVGSMASREKGPSWGWGAQVPATRGLSTPRHPTRGCAGVAPNAPVPQPPAPPEAAALHTVSVGDAFQTQKFLQLFWSYDFG